MKSLLASLLLSLSLSLYGQEQSVQGKVIDKKSREPIGYLNVVVVGTTLGTTTDDAGLFTLRIKPGVYRLQVSGVGYKTVLSAEFPVTTKSVRIDLETEETAVALSDVVVTASPFRSSVESPLGVRTIGFTEIEKSAGSNRDISRVVQSFPGVASSPSGYRNDLVVRGGGPSENKFYVDGIEIPNINHFATQGASGGPVSIINSDLVRDIKFYSSAFPNHLSSGMSSLMDFKLKEGSVDGGYNFSGVVGSSEVGISTDGHLGNKTTYMVSARQSYLQFLFQALKLPFLPTFTDAQVKVTHRFSPRSTLSFLGVVAIDDMKLNTDTVGQSESTKYTLSTLPVVRQFTYTVGAVYKHYAGIHSQTVVVSRNYLSNINFKHINNNESLPRSLDYDSREAENKLRVENLTDWGMLKLNAGGSAELSTYTNTTTQLLFAGNQQQTLHYQTDLTLFKWGLFATLNFESPNQRFTASLGLRTDANTFNSSMRNPLNQLSPRLSLSYALSPRWYLNGNLGRYHQLAPYTTLGFKDNDGRYLNQNIDYLRSDHLSAGVEFRPNDQSRITAEGFYKSYGNGLFSLTDSIPLATKGNDYGVFGAEAVNSSAIGRAYGVEVMGRLSNIAKLDLIASYTFVRSEYKGGRNPQWIPSSWDNRHLFTLTAGYDLPRNWRIGGKFRIIGGAPYTPWDKEKSSLVEAWDATGRPYADYSRFNTLRNPAFTQLDLRVDKWYYLRRVTLGFYFDLQNATNSKFHEQNALLSTGKILNPDAPRNQQRYEMKEIERKAGTLLPALGIIVRF